MKDSLEERDTISLKIESNVEENDISYNVIGTIPGIYPDQIIIGGHYDSYWGQCTMDNSFGPAIAWGIAKYFKDNQITPKYTLKLIAWAGEENMCRGSFFYVNQHIYHGNDNVIAYINVDPVGMDTDDLPLTPWIYPGEQDIGIRLFKRG